MGLSLAVAAVLMLGAAAAPDWHSLLVMRAFVGASALAALVIALDLRRLPRLRPAEMPENEPAEPAA